MKGRLLIMLMAFASVLGFAQSINPLNYSGTMYIKAIEFYSTPRYISYEDHAILYLELRLPTVEITKIKMDFENGTVNLDGEEMKVKVTACKKYDDEFGRTVVVYMDLINEGLKGELVWPQKGDPFFQQIGETDDGIMIGRMVLSTKP
ncbi:MAG: hypothetical protein ACI3ZP_11435 [Candidatus Cryptobacteroides sp.]